MKELEEEKPVNLKKHRQYEYISPRYLFRVFVILATLGFLIYMVFDLLLARENLQQEEIQREKLQDSTNTEVEVEIQSE